MTDADNPDDIERHCYHIIYDMRDFMMNVSRGHVSVGLCEIESDEAGEAMERALYAVWDALLKGTERVIHYRDDESLCELTPTFAAKSFSNAFASRSVELLDSILDDAFTYPDKVDINKGYDIYKYITRLQGELEKGCMQTVLPEDEEEFTEILDEYKTNLSSCSSLNRLRRHLFEEGRVIIELLTDKMEALEKLPVRRIKDIIDKRYMENLSLQDIADELGFSDTYTSKLFKKELGINFAQYLNDVRIQKAKELLEGTNKTLAEIAELTGYNDEKYFMRIFKKNVGITTKEYRRLYGV